MSDKFIEDCNQLLNGYLEHLEALKTGRVKPKDAAKARKPMDTKLRALKKELKEMKRRK